MKASCAWQPKQCFCILNSCYMPANKMYVMVKLATLTCGSKRSTVEVSFQQNKICFNLILLKMHTVSKQ